MASLVLQACDDQKKSSITHDETHLNHARMARNQRAPAAIDTKGESTDGAINKGRHIFALPLFVLQPDIGQIEHKVATNWSETTLQDSSRITWLTSWEPQCPLVQRRCRSSTQSAGHPSSGLHNHRQRGKSRPVYSTN